MNKALKILKDNFIYLAFIVVGLLPVFGLPNYQFYIVERGMQNALVVLSLVILLGFTGQLSLGHAGLVAVGAYFYAITVKNYGFSPWISLILAPVVTGLVGMLLAIPSFKLRGPFLVVNTIAFGEIVRILILNAVDFTGGPFGLKGIKLLFSGVYLYYFMLVVVLIFAIVTLRINKSHIGLAFKAIRDDEVAAEIIGVDVKKYKLLSFVISSIFAGVSGVFFANLTGYLNPDSFTFEISSTYLLMVVMGGMTSTTGGFLSALLVTALPEVLRFLADYRMVIYGLILLIYIRFYKVLDIKKIFSKLNFKKSSEVVE